MIFRCRSLHNHISAKWQLTGSYTWDMTGTMSATKLDKFESHNRTWKVALTYFF